MSAMANESFKEDREMRQEHHSGPGKYVLVWGALMVLTLVTVFTGKMHIETGALALALVIAFLYGSWTALYLTAVLVVVETTDVIFAIDSIPAIFAVTRDPYPGPR